jgi:predicted DNA binding CopG/RHH family protein
MSAKTQRSGVSEKANADSSRRSAGTKIKYTNEPLGDLKVVRDFLPPPEQLAFREEGVKVTLALSKKSVEFFKSEAAKNHTQYQRMIRHLVDAYVDSYAPPLAARSTRTPRKRAAG